MASVSTTNMAQSAFDAYLRTKQALMAAQCYVLSMELMVSLSEHMLHSLLGSPLPTSRNIGILNFGVSQTVEATFNPGTQEDSFYLTYPIPHDLKLGDLYNLPTDPYSHAIESFLSILEIGGRRLERVEQLLGIPPELGFRNSPSVEQELLDQDLRSSLPSRFVELLWNGSVQIDHKSPAVCFRRHRAAILGLLNYNS
jgi:hypothetical protein